MDIKEFVGSTLVQIIEGINDAKEKLKDSGAVISSKNVEGMRGGTLRNKITGDVVNLIDFDVAVSVNEKDAANGGAGINIAGVQFGGQLQNETVNQSVSRIKFSIPLTIPAK